MKLTQIHEIKNHELTFEKIDLQSVLDKLQGDIIATAKNPSKINFEFNYSKKVESDKSMLYGLLFQLFHNSAVWADHSEKDITIKCVIDNKKYGTTIRVSDNGPGIPKELAGEVFDMYKVVNDQTKTHGLGLFIVKKIVEKFKGHVSLRSREGKGTKVTVTLPREN